MIQVKRAYERASKNDGARGVKKRICGYKEVAPSSELRQWFQHDPAKWGKFRRRYFRELEKHPDARQPLLAQARRRRITLVYSAHDTEHNNAVALIEFLDRKIRGKGAVHKAA